MGRYVAGLLKVAWLTVALVGFVSAASADDWKRGAASVDSLDAVARTITLGEEVYRVPTSCRIRGKSGVRIRLSDLRVAIRPGVSLLLMDEIDFVRYEAVKKRRGWEMVEITVLERAPE